MKTKEARGLAKSIISDIDGALAGDPRHPEDRHSAAVSGAILAARLLGGLCVNVARIAQALEDIADTMEDQDDTEDESS